MIVEGTRPAFDFTLEHGVQYKPFVQHFGGHSVPRIMQTVESTGGGITRPLADSCRKHGVDMHLNAKMESFIRDADGRVIGLKVRERYQFPKEDSGVLQTYGTRKGVIMATGGFSRNLWFRMQQDPSLDDRLDSTNHLGATGEGMLEMFAIGGAPVQVDQIQLGPWSSPDEKGFGLVSQFNTIAGFPMGIMVDVRTGKRFCNELADRKARTDAILGLMENGKPVYPVCFTDSKGVAKAQTLRNGLKYKVIWQFDTVEALADHFKIPAAELKAQVARWNEMVAAGNDKEFGRALQLAIQLDKPPFYACRVWPKVHYCMGGVGIDHQARVLTVHGKPIEGLYAAGIKPLQPEGKDALAILSNNSVAMAYAIDAARNAERIVEMTPTVYGLSLEGLNGNVAPILPQTIGARPFDGLSQTAADMRDVLKGSYLWNVDATRPLQDPLSYRVTVYGLSEARRAVKDLNDQIAVQINSTDDNPATILNADEAYRSESTQVANYFVEDNGVKGAIIPSGNFNPLPVALALQRTSIAMAHLSHYSVQRTVHLSYDQFTGLTRFLTDPSNKGHAFGAIQKSFMGLHVDNMALAQPVSLYGMPVAGEIEDTFTNLLQASKRLGSIDTNLYQIYSVEMLHAAQAVDLRRNLKNKDLKLADKTGAFYTAYRAKVPYVKADRIFTDDIRAGVDLLKNYRF